MGVVMVHSAGARVGGSADLAPRGMLGSRHALYALAALAAMFAASHLDVRQFQRLRSWRNPLWWLLALSLGMVVAAQFTPLGRSAHGARRWLYMGPRHWNISFQPSELVKWIMVIAIAWWCARRQGAMRRLFGGLMPPLVLVAGACGLIMMEDLGTGVLIATVAVLCLLAGGARSAHVSLFIPPAVGAVGLLIWMAPFRMARLLAFVDPWRDPEGTGYHPIQSMLAIAGGGLAGRGLGNGVQKLGYLPEDKTDFLFAVICEELGLPGAALVVGLVLVVIWTGLGIIRDCNDPFARLLALGVLFTFGLQSLLNLAVVSVMVPTKGIALPLLSSGGTGWILTAFSLGLVASLDVARHLEQTEGDEAIRAPGEPALP